MSFFEVKRLRKRFGGLYAVNDLTFGVDRGEIVGLIGPNGSGKTTTINMITNSIAPDGGQIFCNGVDITHHKTHQIVKSGITRTYQLTTLFMNMTVLENILLGFHIQKRAFLESLRYKSYGSTGQETSFTNRAMEMLEFVGVADLRNELAKNLPHGHQRCVALAIALASNPQLILLDEPMSGMNEKERSAMMERLLELKRNGIGILLVEHDMRVVMGVCDRIVVLNFGKKIAEGPPKEVQVNEEVVKAYLGEVDAPTD
jgi:branched-chain amino acid transport system ATP-binding protein